MHYCSTDWATLLRHYWAHPTEQLTCMCCVRCYWRLLNVQRVHRPTTQLSGNSAKQVMCVVCHVLASFT